jgi:hypothetical protein
MAAALAFKEIPNGSQYSKGVVFDTIGTSRIGVGHRAHKLHSGSPPRQSW